jgi:methylenetetrahydrofolate dehydrogenase (NADP+) / methenyltetrahydrofolate cyclohydrolase
MILEGRSLRDSILEKLRGKISSFPRSPKLRVILVGENPASLSYIRQKEKAAASIGMSFELLNFPENASEETVLRAIDDSNKDSNVDGVIVQLPLPAHFDSGHIIDAISPDKDVDGYSKQNIANVFLGLEQGLQSCTPKGVMRLLKHYGIDIAGKNAVMMGYGAVGKPMSAMLANAGATVTVCTQKTKDPSMFTKTADIIVVAVGKPGLLTRDMVKPGAVIIDVGISRTPEGIKGDAEFEQLKDDCDISPVPGGVGPMTVSMLLENTVQAYENGHMR